MEGKLLLGCSAGFKNITQVGGWRWLEVVGGETAVPGFPSRVGYLVLRSQHKIWAVGK